MQNTTEWNPLRSGRAAAMWGAGIAAAAIGGVLWNRRGQRSWPGMGRTLGRDRASEAIDRLIQTCRDGENGFDTAADAIDDPEIGSLFRKYSQQRRGCRLELEAHARRVGHRPQASGSVSGTAHHAWINIKSLVMGRDTGAILAEAERGEDIAVREYEHALDAGLPTELEAVVRRQLREVRSVHDRVRDLRDTHTRTH